MGRQQVHQPSRGERVSTPRAAQRLGNLTVAKPWHKSVFLPALVSAFVAVAAQPQNVIIVNTDDHAQWAVGAYGNKEVHTPNIDRLAREGMRFNRAFSKPVCSPSRAMMLTGQYSHRVG